MSHTYSSLFVHVVFSTKDRTPLIDADLRPRLHAYMGGIAREELGSAIQVGGTEDHVHGLLMIRPNISVSEAMAKWKSLSSGWVNKLNEKRPRFAWQVGYGAFSVSQSASAKVVEYIENQEDHHRRFTFQEEFLELLRRHDVEYDPSTIWN